MRNFLNAALMFVIMACASSAMAEESGDWRLGATLASKHFINAPESIGEFCEENLGLEVEYQLTDTVHIGAGRYRNSVCERSTFISLGKELESGLLWDVPVSAGIEIGAASGYSDFFKTDDSISWASAGDYLLLGGPYVRAGDQHSIKIRYLVALIAASYQYEF